MADFSLCGMQQKFIVDKSETLIMKRIAKSYVSGHKKIGSRQSAKMIGHHDSGTQ